MKEYVFRLDGIMCAACVSGVGRALDGCNTLTIKGYKVSEITHLAKIEVDAEGEDQPTIDKLIDLMDAFDPQYQPALIAKQNTATQQEQPIQVEDHRSSIKKHIIKGLIGLLMGLGLMAWMLLGMDLSFLWMALITGASIITTGYIGYKLSWDAIKKGWKHRIYGMDILFAVSALAAIAISIAHLFIPGLPMMLDAALLLFGFRHLGKAIELGLKKRLIQKKRFTDELSDHYWVESPDKKNRLLKKRDELSVGDILVIQPGEMVPLDAVACESGFVDSSNKTGENEVWVNKEDAVFSSTCIPNNGRALRVRCVQNKENSFLYQFESLLSSDYSQTTKIEKKTHNLTLYFLPTVVGVSLIVGIIASFFFPPIIAVQSAMYVLVSACPCILGMIVPLSLRAGILKARTLDVDFKTGAALEALPEMDVFVFDLFGTLTQAKLEVKTDIESEYFSIIAAMEKDATHLLGQAIHTHVAGKEGKAVTIEKLSETGTGIKAIIGGEEYTIGNESMMNTLIPGFDASRYPKKLGHRIFFAKGQTILGSFEVSDPLRTDARESIAALIKQGKEVRIISGTSQATLSAYAEALGVHPDYVKCCTPLEKYAYIESLKKTYKDPRKTTRKKVVMVGDGGNDAGAMKICDLGIVVKSGASHLRTQALASLFLDCSASMAPIVNALTVSKQTLTHIRRTLFLSFTYNVLSLTLLSLSLVYFSGHLPLAAGAGIMILQTIGVLCYTHLFANKKVAAFASPPKQGHTLPPVLIGELNNGHPKNTSLFNGYKLLGKRTHQMNMSLISKSTAPDNKIL